MTTGYVHRLNARCDFCNRMVRQIIHVPGFGKFCSSICIKKAQDKMERIKEGNENLQNE